MADPLPMLTMFDKQIQLRMGQANVKRWVDDILPLLTDDDPLGVDDFATHRLPLDRGAARLRDLPEEAGRRDQDRPHTLTTAGAAPRAARRTGQVSCRTDRMLPAGSLNHAMRGPPPRKMPFSSASRPG